VFNWHIALRGVFLTVCGGKTFLFVAFVLALGVPAVHVARFAAAMSLGVIFQILVLGALRLVSDRRRFVLRLGALEPLVFLIAVGAALVVPQGARSALLLVGVFAAAGLMHMSRPVYDDWLSSTIPARLRGRYLGRRVQFYSIAIILTTVAAGWLGDMAGKENVYGLAAILCGASVFGFLSVFALSRADATHQLAAPAVGLSQVWRVLRVVPFRRYLAAVLAYNAPFLLATPYYQVLNQKVLRMSLTSVGILSILYLVSLAASSRLMGRLSDKFAPWKLLLGMGPLYVVFFGLMALAATGRIWPVFVGWGMVGVADSAYMVASRSALYGAVPTDRPRPAFFAVANLAEFGIYAIGAVLAEWVVSSLAETGVRLGPFSLGQYGTLYAICAVLVLPAACGALFLRPAR